MTDPVDPPRRIQNTRRYRRRASDPAPQDLRPGETTDTPNLPMATAEPPREERRAPRQPSIEPNASVLAAHLIGQEHRRRGLKGGQPVLDEARIRYLGTEYSGQADRRPRAGRITKTEI
ncbi:MAG: hypothetical protein BGN86_06335 [Caulobacterales bacterium 68-7]|nr:hypothetical protein [Caulobacterales bacterium]OJU13555.1 MAG: hypothetical protein BGN86_06335 [Caulobacterales bacterium 68-7]